MAHYLLQISYTPEAWAALIRNPQDRAETVRGPIEKLGGKVERIWLAFGEDDIVGIVEMPNNVAAAISIAFAGGGACKNVKTTPLMSIQEGMEAMKKAEGDDNVFHKPVIYQEFCKSRRPVSGEFALLTKNEIGFTLGTYDRSRRVVIDPMLAYSTYLGGNGYRIPAGPDCCGDSVSGIAVDSSGRVYVTGTTGSSNFPVSHDAFQPSNRDADGQGNAFVTKLNPDGSKLIYSTYLGGSGFNTGASFDGDIGTGIAVDKSGDSYITGSTFSKGFPVTKNAFQRVNKAAAINSSNVFASKPNAEATALVCSTYVGGSGVHQNCCYYFAGADYGTGIAVDSEGYAYLIGYAHSKDFPVTAGAFQKTNRAHSSINGTGVYDTNAFITKLNLTGTTLVYSTYLGGSGGEFYGDQANGIAVGRSGAAFVTGQAISADFPVTKGAFQLANRDAANLVPNAFVTKINPAGNGLVYSTFLGGSGGHRSPGDSASGIAVNGSGEAYVIGTTYSSDFPVTTDAFQKHNHQSANPGADYYSGNVLHKLDATGSALLYSSYIGGSGNPSGGGGDVGSAIAVGGAGNAFLTGYTLSHDFPVSQDAFQPVNNAYKAGHHGATNAFVVKLNVGGIE